MAMILQHLLCSSLFNNDICLTANYCCCDSQQFVGREGTRTSLIGGDARILRDRMVCVVVQFIMFSSSLRVTMLRQFRRCRDVLWLKLT